MWIEIATADPNELMQLHLLPCPKCYEAEPNPTQQPNPHCTNCHGAGVEQVYITDTRKLRGTAKRLYGGVRRTKYGAELILRNQDAALANIAKHLGMFDKAPEAPSNDTALIEQLNHTDDPVKASQIYQQLMGKG
jgi:phage terminase small subunit